MHGQRLVLIEMLAIVLRLVIICVEQSLQHLRRDGGCSEPPDLWALR